MLPRQRKMAIIIFREQHDFLQQSTASASGLSGLLFLLFFETYLVNFGRDSAAVDETEGSTCGAT